MISTSFNMPTRCPDIPRLALRWSTTSQSCNASQRTFRSECGRFRTVGENAFARRGNTDSGLCCGTGHPVIAPKALINQPADLVIVMNPIYVPEIELSLKEMGLRPEIVALSPMGFT